MESKSLFQKLVVCVLAGLVCGETFLRIAMRFLSFIPMPGIVGISGSILLAALVGAFVWHRKERREGEVSLSTNSFWIGAIRYGIAFDLAMFGFQKIFHLQFFTPLGMLDEPFSSFSNEWLTWSYFGRSYGFAFTIGASQIIGSLLLVFNRTRLLGTIVLMPVILNIIFIDYFYELHIGVQIHAIVLFAGLIYLLMLDYRGLVDFFLVNVRRDLSYHVRNNFLKNAGRLSIVVVPLLLIATYQSPTKHPELRGKYAVTELKLNGKLMPAPVCSDSLLSIVYLDLGNDCVFEFNSLKRRMIGRYAFDEQTGAMSSTWHYPRTAVDKEFKGTMNVVADGRLRLAGEMAGDTMVVELERINRPR